MKAGHRSKYEGADWSRCTKDLAAHYGVSETAMQAARHRYGKPGPRSPVVRASRWRKADWSKCNKELAEQHGVTLHCVQQARTRHGASGPRSPHRKGGGAKQRKAVEIAAKLGERKTVHQWLNQIGVPQTEFGKPISLLRRLAIALGIQPSEEYRPHLKRGFSMECSKPLPPHIQTIRSEPYPPENKSK